MTNIARFGAVLAACRRRIEPVFIETAAYANQLGRVVAALRLLPSTQHHHASPVIVLMPGQHDGLFLRVLRVLRLAPPTEPRWVPDIDALEVALTALSEAELIVAREVYTRFHAAFAARGLSHRLRIV